MVTRLPPCPFRRSCCAARRSAALSVFLSDYKLKQVKHIKQNETGHTDKGQAPLSQSHDTHTTPREDTQQSQTERHWQLHHSTSSQKHTFVYGSVYRPPSAQLPLASVSSTAGSNTPTALRRFAWAPPSSLDGQRAQPDVARGPPNGRGRPPKRSTSASRSPPPRAGRPRRTSPPRRPRRPPP